MTVSNGLHHLPSAHLIWWGMRSVLPLSRQHQRSLSIRTMSIDRLAQSGERSMSPNCRVITLQWIIVAQRVARHGQLRPSSQHRADAA